MDKAWPRTSAMVLALVIIVFGFLISSSGYRVIEQEWHSISSAFAAYAVTWLLAGVVMFATGLWVVGSRGRRRFPLWLGGTAAFIAGASLVAGVLSHVVPCSGPS